MTDRELVGQRMVVGFYGTELNEDIKDLIINYKIANIILFKHNVFNNRQLNRLCKEIQELVMLHTGHPAFITMDQEGGMVTRLGEDGVNIPGAMALAAIGNLEDVYEAGKITGIELRSIGINFNLSPTVDVNSNCHNPVIGVRSYGDDPEKVGTYGAAMTRGLLDGGVYACGKHFPGHGDTNVDSHVGLPVIYKDKEELYQCELIPFIEVIRAGIPAIMTTHILFPKIEKENVPATMSKTIITDLLRGELWFEGLIVSDCMEMDAIKKYYGTVKGAMKAIEAGVDMVFVSHTASLAKEVSDAMVDALTKGELHRNEMKVAVDRILSYKDILLGATENNYGHRNISQSVLTRTTKFEKRYDIDYFSYQEFAWNSKEYVMNLLRKSITKVTGPYEEFALGENPLFLGVEPFRATNVSEEGQIHFVSYLQETLGGSGICLSSMPTEEEITHIIESLKKGGMITKEGHSKRDTTIPSSVVIGTYNGHIYNSQLKLVEAIAKVHNNVIVFALRNPYDLANLPEGVIGIAVYEYTSNSLAAIKEVLLHEFELTGKLSVKL